MSRRFSRLICLKRVYQARPIQTNGILFVPPGISRANNTLALSYDYGTSNKKLLWKTISQTLDEAREKFPDNEAVVFSADNVRLSYHEFAEKVDAFATGLIALGLKPGERIGIWGQNHLEWLITFYGAVKAGLVVVNINPAYKADELEFALNKVGIKVLVLMPKFKSTDYIDILNEVLQRDNFTYTMNSQRIPSLKHVISTEGVPPAGVFSFKDIEEKGGKEKKQQLIKLQCIMQPDDLVNIQFTSGTTGRPKAATLTNHGMINNAALFVDYLAFHGETRLCNPMPLYHSFGLTCGSIACTSVGATQVYPSRGFDTLANMKAIEEERCTTIYGTPVVFIDMLNHPEFKNYDFTSLRTGLIGASPIPKKVFEKIVCAMHCPGLLSGYGSTELSPITNLTTTKCSIEDRSEFSGPVVPNTELKIVDKGKVVPVSQPGEICIRGTCVFPGYWDDEEKTKEVIDKNGWFHTGDVGIMDERGYLKVVGRIKDMIIRGGENIYPTEIENFLHKHPKVFDVQVIGVDDERMGEEVCAVIKKNPNEECSEQEIKDFCKGKVSHFKIPRYVYFVDEYPLTVTGKVQKFLLRQQIAKLVNSPKSN